MPQQKTSQIIYSILFGLTLLCLYGITYKNPTTSRIANSQKDQRLVDVQESFRG